VENVKNILVRDVVISAGVVLIWYVMIVIHMNVKIRAISVISGNIVVKIVLNGHYANHASNMHVIIVAEIAIVLLVK